MVAPRFEPQDPDFAARVRASFAKQQAMHTIGASVAEVAPGRVVIELPWQQALTQQHGFLHAGMVACFAKLARTRSAKAGSCGSKRGVSMGVPG